MDLKTITAFFLAALLSVFMIIPVSAEEENGDPEVELIAEFDNDIFEADETPSFTAAFGTHTKMPSGTSATLAFETEGCELETGGKFGYTTIALDKYVCRTSQNGGYYPSYGEKVSFAPSADRGYVSYVLEIKDSGGEIIHTKECRVWFISRDGLTAVSDEGYDGCEENLDKPLYRVILFMRTPLGTVVKILLVILIMGGMYCILHRREVRRFIRSRRQRKKESNDNGGDTNG